MWHGNKSQQTDFAGFSSLCIGSYPTKHTKETLEKELKALKSGSWAFHSLAPGLLLLHFHLLEAERSTNTSCSLQLHDDSAAQSRCQLVAKQKS